MSQSIASKRILVIRLDRLGDVVLTTPVLSRLRRALPSAEITMLVQPACGELLDGHPDLTDVLRYDKAGRHRSLWSTVAFALALRRRRFDVALAVHPTRRSHWIAWLAGIPVRIGYDRKSPWLLTRRLPHRKQEGACSEAAYALELLTALGVPAEPGDRAPRPTVAVSAAARQHVARFLREQGADEDDGLIAVHPSASCPSKRWPAERFAAAADALAAEHQVRIIVIAGPSDLGPARAMLGAMRHPAIDAAGRLSVGALAALLSRCRLLVSNDSGPVHVAVAVGTPVVDIFGRNQAGLSPARWGPLGQGHVVLHQEVGCRVCLAHACPIGFFCLQAVSVRDVIRAAGQALRRA